VVVGVGAWWITGMREGASRRASMMSIKDAGGEHARRKDVLALHAECCLAACMRCASQHARCCIV